jgi:hypothetical protein
MISFPNQESEVCASSADSARSIATNRPATPEQTSGSEFSVSTAPFGSKIRREEARLRTAETSIERRQKHFKTLIRSWLNFLCLA